MFLSKYLLPVLNNQPTGTYVKSHNLMIRSGMIKQQLSGIYSWLPLGFEVLKNISDIIRNSMNKVGAIEMLMPCVQPVELWVKSGRIKDYGKEILQFKDRNSNQLLFGPTNEDMMLDIFKNSIKSYKELPKTLYHIQWKFRDEIRPRFGVMRSREFLMKDAYSFDYDQESALKSYNNMYLAYIDIFLEMGLKIIPAVADNGPIGGVLSHEFHVIANSGESTIYYDRKFDTLNYHNKLELNLIKSLPAYTSDKYNKDVPYTERQGLKITKGIEVGHIFYIGTKYSNAMSVYITNNKSKLIPVEMSSYGIGISRLVGAIIESNHDDKGIIWPYKIAPFKVLIVNLNTKNSKCSVLSESIYSTLKNLAIKVLYDDTDQISSYKFSHADLIGIPIQVIIGPEKANQNLVDLKDRKTGNLTTLSLDALIQKITSINNA